MIKNIFPIAKKTFTLAAFSSLFLLGAATDFCHAETAPIPLRGIVEGFYGTPWQQADRLDILTFCNKHDLNAYIYAPKDDPYHRAKWREPYPDDKMKELSSLISAAKKQKVRFVFAVSPGLDIKFTGFKGFQDRIAMYKKLQAMYDLGVRDFAIFFDDIQEKDGEGQALFLNWLSEKFIATHYGVNPLITVPTEYFRADMHTDGVKKPYTEAFTKNLNPEILVLYTGDGVVPDGLSDEQLAAANKLYDRTLGIWWNYPVTDYMENKLALGPVEKLPENSTIPAIFFNPMKYEQLSKITLATGADYAKDPHRYRAQKSWEKAIAEQFGPLAKDMQRVADQSQHLENNWAKIGRPDGQELREAINRYWESNRSRAAETALQEQLQSLHQSAVTLMAQLPKEILAECSPQLQQLMRITNADLTGMEWIKNPNDEKLKQKFLRQREQVQQHDKEAIIAETSARAFLNEIGDYVDRQEKAANEKQETAKATPIAELDR
ncbi:protein O-GlcNAcase [Selenomonas sp.]|uniref:protein O-GlcNAcase n=1 Tax=Selenomonas sp. TaxID=2053611 RepID=UPI0025F45EBF|nr:protein O-GlcNAcase [Selenomonas sp.]MBQ1868003.1 beta-N-acetylglucosaminidase domain-containing protein [Selenomonas sp.]